MQPSPAEKKPTIEDFYVGKGIGKGNFTNIFLAEELKTKKEFALKQANKQTLQNKFKIGDLLMERHCLYKMKSCSWVVDIHSTFQDPINIYIQMELMKGPELWDKIKFFGMVDRNVRKLLMFWIAQAVKAMHNEGIIHRDIKPENIMFNKNMTSIKFIDFGSAKDVNNPDRKDSLNFFIYNVLPGTTSAAGVKAIFLKEIVLGETEVEEISQDFALEQLSHMKGGPSVAVLLDLALGDDEAIAVKATKVLKTQVFLYEADTDRLVEAMNSGNALAKEIIESYSQAEFFTKLPEIDEEIEVVTYVAGVGDISTDLLSPGADAHSRSDRELHGQSMFEHNKEMQQELLALKEKHPNKRVMLIADKGTMGVGSSRMSGVNNVALWTGISSSPYVPFINIAPVIAGTNGIAPIFLTTVGVTGGIGIDLKNWVKQKDADGNTIVDAEGDPILKEEYSVATGTVLTINTKSKKL